MKRSRAELGRVSPRPCSSTVSQGGEERVGSRVVAKSLADVGEEIGVPRPENEAPAQLKRIQAELMLPVSRGLGPLAAPGIVAAKHVKQASNAKARDFVRAPLFVNQQRKIDSRFLLKNVRVVPVAQADGRERRAFLAERLLVFAQLRDVFAAKNSSVVAQKHHHGGISLPQRSQAHFPPGGVGKSHVGEPPAQRFWHPSSWAASQLPVKPARIRKTIRTKNTSSELPGS